jgi:uncharacterized SAM-binding protein YcdF (DUF218 family)
LDNNAQRSHEGLPVRRPFSFSGLRIKRRWIVLAAFLCVLLAAYLLRTTILIGLARWLEVSDPLVRSDIIYVMGGDASSRPIHAAELYKRGLAPKIVIPRDQATPAEQLGVTLNESEAAVRVMIRSGVPAEAIQLLSPPGGSTSTVEDARLLAGYLQDHHITRAIVVTTAFHSRRTRWAMHREIGALPLTILMAPVDDFAFNEKNWWRVERGMLAYIEEYIKFVHNWAQR